MTLENIQATTAVQAVTVYPDRARVVRRGEVEVDETTQRVVIGDLPLTLVAESVRVGGSGTARVRIMGVDVRRAFFEQAPVTRVRELEARIQAVRDERRVVSDRRTGQEARLAYLDGLRSETRAFARGLARGDSTVEAQADLLRFLQEEDTAVRSQIRAGDGELRQLDDRLQKLEAELKQLVSARPRQRMEAVVELQVSQAGGFTPELSYVVRDAGWTPLYDTRLVQGRVVELTYLAQVTQRTGEDWSAAITVSTARPALNQRLPDLRPWYLDELHMKPRAAAMLMAADAAPELERAERRTLKMAAPPPQAAPAPAEVATAAANVGDLAVSYTLPGTLDVPSDGSPHKGVIGVFELKPELDYVTVPRHTDAVYRRIKLRNETPGPLLAGPANLFVDEEFIGATQLEYAPAGDEIELLLGVEERITVERELIRRDVDKRLLRDNRQLSYAYEIKLENLLDRAVSVTVRDQIPVSRHESIRVKLIESDPQPAEQSDLNLLRWVCPLPAGGKTSVTYAYQVEHPRQMNVDGLQD